MLPLLVLGLLVCLLGALLLLRVARQGREAGGLPPGEVVFSDTGTWQPVRQPLLSRRYGLVGKPDYLVQTPGLPVPIPVEVKSGRRPANAYPGHIVQLAAYCLLVEDQWQAAPAFGLLHYTGGGGRGAATLRIDFTPSLRSELLALLDEMRADRRAQQVPRSHDDPARCRGCGLAHACDQRIA